MKRLMLLLNCMLCLLPVMANGASLSKVRTTPTKAQMLTCRALLSHVDQDNAAARTLLRLLDYGLKTSAPGGGTLLSSAELAELLKSERPINPKKSPNNSIERTYYVSLQNAVEALKETQWSYVKSEVAKVLKIEKEKDEVVGDAQAQSDMIYFGSLLLKRSMVHAKSISSYKDRSGMSYFIFLDNHNMSMIVARDEQALRNAKIHVHEIEGDARLDVPVSPVFYESNDGTVMLAVASLDSVLLYPISENGFGELRGKVVIKSPKPKWFIPSSRDELFDGVTALGLYKSDEEKTILIVQSRLRELRAQYAFGTHFSRIIIEDLLATQIGEADWLAESDRVTEYRLERLSVTSSSKDQLILKQALAKDIIDDQDTTRDTKYTRFLRTIYVNIGNNTVDVDDQEYAFGGLENERKMAYYQLPSGDYLFARFIGDILNYELEIYVAPELRLNSSTRLIFKTRIQGDGLSKMSFHEFANGHITLLFLDYGKNLQLYSVRGGAFDKHSGKQHE